jgi:hypothetical protein
MKKLSKFALLFVGLLTLPAHLQATQSAESPQDVVLSGLKRDGQVIEGTFREPIQAGKLKALEKLLETPLIECGDGACFSKAGKLGRTKSLSNEAFYFVQFFGGPTDPYHEYARLSFSQKRIILEIYNESRLISYLSALQSNLACRDRFNDVSMLFDSICQYVQGYEFLAGLCDEMRGFLLPECPYYEEKFRMISGLLSILVKA